jgi:hypothetical protein
VQLGGVGVDHLLDLVVVSDLAGIPFDDHIERGQRKAAGRQ